MKNSGGIFDVPEKINNRTELESLMSAPTFWDDKENAQKVVGELSACKSIIDPFVSIETQIHDFQALVELVAEEGHNAELVAEAASLWPSLIRELKQLEIVSFLNGRFDKGNAILTLHPGSGGTESCDWTSMLFRMYMRWIEKRGYQGQIIDRQPDDVAGIKSATVVVTGPFAYGYLRSERGVHRLVRISPFDSNKRRHTSFAAVEIVPEIDDDVEIEIDEKELRVDTYRSSGAGGQHVNTTDSAVRITHIASGIVVACQNERSQHQNRATAMRILRSKLYERQMAEIEAERTSASGPKEDNAWGSQIRSYVLHPYQMVKDLRTGEETSDTTGVLDGDLEKFIEAYLRNSELNDN